MGLSCSGDIFNINTDNLIYGIPDTHKSMDDVLGQGVGKNMEEARENLRGKLNTLLMRMSERNIKLSPEKFKISSDMEFGEFRVRYNSETGRPEILPDKAIKQPSTKKEVESIVGSIKQLSSWSGQTTNLTTNMRQLICKDSHFRWTGEHEKEWLKVKKMLRDLSHVTPFRMGDKVEVYCDGS